MYRDYIDPVTGERLRGKFTSEEKIESYKKKMRREEVFSIERQVQESYTGRDFVFMDMMKARNKKYTSTDLATVGAMLVLATYTVYDKCKSGKSLLGYSKDNLFKSIEKDFSKVLNCSIRQAKRYYRTLNEAKFVKKECGEFFIDESLFYRGINREKKHIVKVYHLNVRNLLKRECNLGDIGLLFLTAPYMDFKTNILCRNPNRKLNEIEPISLDELADILGIDRSTLTRKFNKLIIYHDRTELQLASYLTVTSPQFGKKLIKVNPMLLHRYNDQNTWNGIGDFVALGRKKE